MYNELDLNYGENMRKITFTCILMCLLLIVFIGCSKQAKIHVDMMEYLQIEILEEAIFPDGIVYSIEMTNFKQ